MILNFEVKYCQEINIFYLNAQPLTYLTIGIEAAIWPLSCIGETTDIARQEKKTLRWLVVADLVWSKYADPPVDGGCADVVDKGAEIKGPDLQVFVGDHLKLGH